ncbi:MAG: hypothetical protein AAF570_02210 [Bacteroidota bacterium]
MKNKVGTALMALLAMVVLVACAGRKKMIRSSGLHAIKLGDALPAPGTKALKGVALRDTLLEDGEYTWRASMMQYKNGPVYLEEDFYRSEQLNRIRIETPDLKLRNGLRVGKTVSDLVEVGGEWFVSPLPRFKLFDVYSRKFPRVHFLVDAPGNALDKDFEEYSLDQFDPGSKIVAIVVF